MSQWFDSLEEGWAAQGFDEPEREEHDDEDPNDPSTWDLMSGRAADPDPLAGFGALGVRELLTIILDGAMPDGSDATDVVRGYALDVALKEKGPGQRGKSCGEHRSSPTRARSRTAPLSSITTSE